MMVRTLNVIVFLMLVTAARSSAQDTLPRLTVRNVNSKIIVSWKATYGARINTINIQRSKDSTKNFTTIGSVLEPMNRENGFVDNKAPAPDYFYRVFVAFEGGNYIFTKSYRPIIDTGTTVVNNDPFQLQEVKPASPPPPPPAPTGFVASKYIYTAKDNNVLIELPDTSLRKYSIKFYDEKDKLVFEMKQVPEQSFIIEKVNFLHAGWFYFMLYKDGILKEKNQFYIPKEGKYGIPPGELMHRKFK